MTTGQPFPGPVTRDIGLFSQDLRGGNAGAGHRAFGWICPRPLLGNGNGYVHFRTRWPARPVPRHSLPPIGDGDRCIGHRSKSCLISSMPPELLWPSHCALGRSLSLSFSLLDKHARAAMWFYAGWDITVAFYYRLSGGPLNRRTSSTRRWRGSRRIAARHYPVPAWCQPSCLPPERSPRRCPRRRFDNWLSDARAASSQSVLRPDNGKPNGASRGSAATPCCRTAVGNRHFVKPLGLRQVGRLQYRTPGLAPPLHLHMLMLLAAAGPSIGDRIAALPETDCNRTLLVPSRRTPAETGSRSMDMAINRPTSYVQRSPAFQPKLNAGPSWDQIMIASLLIRLRELVDLLHRLPNSPPRHRSR